MRCPPRLEIPQAQHRGRTFRLGATYAARPVAGREPSRQRRRTVERLERLHGTGAVWVHARDRGGPLQDMPLVSFARWAGDAEDGE